MNCLSASFSFTAPLLAGLGCGCVPACGAFCAPGVVAGVFCGVVEGVLAGAFCGAAVWPLAGGFCFGGVLGYGNSPQTTINPAITKNILMLRIYRSFRTGR